MKKRGWIIERENRGEDNRKRDKGVDNSERNQ
jgi:hypothetical protein